MIKPNQQFCIIGEGAQSYQDLVDLLNSSTKLLKSTNHPLVSGETENHRPLTLRETCQLKIEAYKSGYSRENSLFTQDLDTSTHFYFLEKSHKFLVFPKVDVIPRFENYVESHKWLEYMIHDKTVHRLEFDALKTPVKEVFIGALDGDENVYNEYDGILLNSLKSKDNANSPWMFVEFSKLTPKSYMFKNAKLAGFPYVGVQTFFRVGEEEHPNLPFIIFAGRYRTALLK
jgi:hypothetical protein